jgi:hypothetical protein
MFLITESQMTPVNHMKEECEDSHPNVRFAYPQT